jgi:hypothetical protein
MMRESLIFGCVVALMLGASTSCNRAAVRVPGTAGTFHPTNTGFRSEHRDDRLLYIEFPVDSREAHFGERVAATRWRGCRTDTFWGDAAPRIIRDELAAEIGASGLFSQVVIEPPQSDHLTLRTNIRAFCSQVIGIFFVRVAGITSLEFSLLEGDAALLDDRLDRVVTDADDEYTGSSIGFIKQAMRITMSDSLRELLREFLPMLQAAVRGPLPDGAPKPTAP